MKKQIRKLEKKVGVIILLFGIIIFVVGITNINSFVSFIESLSDHEFIQIAIMSGFFALLSVIPMSLYYYVEDKRKSEKNIKGKVI